MGLPRPGVKPLRPRRRRRGWASPRLAVALVTLALAGVLGPTSRAGDQLSTYISATNVAGRVGHVRDGDTIEVAGTAIRFARLNCPELGTGAGDLARQRMKMLVSGQRLQCRLSGRSSYDRQVGSCRLPDGRDLATAMRDTGMCTR